MSKPSKPDIHQEITNNIINLLDQVDVNNYQPPFAGLAAQGLPQNPITNHHYQGVNILALWFNQQAKQFSSNKWATFKQWKEQGANVKKGEKGSRIIFYKTLVKEEENSKGHVEEKTIPMLKLYSVFNAHQVEGFEDTQSIPLPEKDEVNCLSVIDEFCKQTQAKIKNIENQAYYHPEKDFINMPETRMFLKSSTESATENYYSTLLHEMTHWTGAKKRLNRSGITQLTNEKEYAFEELIAELGAAFLCAKFNIAQSLPENHAIYIKSWLKHLKEDKTHIFKAAAQAAKAVNFLNDMQMEG